MTLFVAVRQRLGESIACILTHGDWLYTAGPGSVFRCRHNRKDGRYENQSVVAKAFARVEPESAYGLSIDFDGSLLITAGPGNHDVKGSDGSRAVVKGSGAVFRCRPDGAHLELLATGLGEPGGGAVFDRHFEAFQLDVSRGGTRQRAAFSTSLSKAILAFVEVPARALQSTMARASIACATFLE